MIDFIVYLYRNTVYEYGSCGSNGNVRLARRNRFFGNVQFRLRNYQWIDFDSYWWGGFVKDDDGI